MWADTEKFVPGNASLYKTYFSTGTEWNNNDNGNDLTGDGVLSSTTIVVNTKSYATYDNSNGQIQVHINSEKGDADWHAQVHLQTNVSFDASKDYDISFKMTTSNGIGNIIVKMGDANYLYEDRITTGASVEYTYSHANVKGKAGNDGILVFDFSRSPANTNITISNISIVEKEAVPAEPISYCDYEIGHSAAANADNNSFVLLSVSSDGDGHTTVTIKQDAAKNTQMFDYLQVSGHASTGADVDEGGSDHIEVTFNTPAADSNGDITLEILWSTVNWNGRWMVQNLKVPANATCATPSSDTEKPSMAEASVSIDSKTHNTVVIAITGATDNEGITKYVVKNHTDDSSVGEYAPAENKITVNGLNSETPYNWDIYAKDAAGNVSDNSKNITFTTDALVANYCGETLSDGNGATIDMSCEFKNGKYFISFTNPTLNSEASSLAGFNGSFCSVDGTGSYDARNSYSVNNSEKIVLEYDGVPNFFTSLYINIPANAQRTFTWPNDVVWGSCPAVAVTGVSLNSTELAMQVGGVTQTLIATVTPANATNQNVSWHSDNEEVATVENGVVTAVGEGSTAITVTTEDGSRTATCEVTVTVPAIARKVYTDYATTDTKNIFIHYSVIRNTNQTLTFKFEDFEYLPELFGFVAPQVWVNEVNLGNMSLEEGKYSFTTEGTYTTVDEELSCKFHLVYGGGGDKYINFSYTVGSEQAAPASIPAGAVVLNRTSNSLSVGETDVLTATVYPSFATAAGSITWTSDATGVATVENGTVTATAEGTAHITAACGEVNAQYTVTVAASLEEAKYHGTGAFTNFADSKDAFAYEYTFTRATNHEVTLEVVFSEDMTPYIGTDNFRLYVSGNNNKMDYDAATKTATYHFGSQSEGAGISYYFYFIMAGGVHQSAQVTYTVGSSNEKVYACVVDEDVDNADVLEAYNGRTAQVIIDRSFTAGNLYTLVLPFNVDAAMRAEKLPGQLTRLNNTIVKENDDLRINFVDVEAIEAGVPYLYSPSADVANPVFAGVTIHKELHPTEPTDNYAKYYGIYAPMNGLQLHGITNGYVLGNDQYLYTTSSLVETQVMNALRGYFVLNFPTGGGANSAPRARVVFNSHETETTTDVSYVQDDNVPCTKVLRDGQLLIIRDGRTFNAQGQLIQ